MRTILTGIATGFTLLAANFLTSWIFQAIYPSISTEYQNTCLFRPWSDPLMSLMFLHPILLGVILAWIWQKVKSSLVGKVSHPWFSFAMIYFAFSLPGMLISYSSFPVSFALILSWIVGIFIQSLIAGAAYSKFLK